MRFGPMHMALAIAAAFVPRHASAELIVPARPRQNAVPFIAYRADSASAEQLVELASKRRRARQTKRGKRP